MITIPETVPETPPQTITEVVATPEPPPKPKPILSTLTPSHRIFKMSKIQNLIENQNFSYLQPYFYEHETALRCELGTGETDTVWMQNARKRALAVFRILFPEGNADAVIFNEWLYDGDPEEDFSGILNTYRHKIIRNLPVPDWNTALHRNRIICYADDKLFPCEKIIQNLLLEDFGVPNHEESFVSFCNECILSVYDDRGCDIFFADVQEIPGVLSDFRTLLSGL